MEPGYREWTQCVVSPWCWVFWNSPCIFVFDWFLIWVLKFYFLTFVFSLGIPVPHVILTIIKSSYLKLSQIRLTANFFCLVIFQSALWFWGFQPVNCRDWWCLTCYFWKRWIPRFCSQKFLTGSAVILGRSRVAVRCSRFRYGSVHRS